MIRNIISRYAGKGSLALNMVYALGNCALGLATPSYWFITAGAYYIILSVMRFAAVRSAKKSEGNFIMRFCGAMLLAMSVVLAGTAYMTSVFDVGREIHEIAMITIATYTFAKITVAIVLFVKRRNNISPVETTVRSISCTDAAVSVFSLQRSMLVSFGEMSAENIRIFNVATGIGVCLIVVAFGIYLIIKKGETEDDEIENIGDE